MREARHQAYAHGLEAIEDVDQNLYGGFVGNEDCRLLNKPCMPSGEQLARLHTKFADAYLPELLLRHRVRNFPDTLNEEEYEPWEQFRAERLFEGRDGYMIFETSNERLQQLNVRAEENGDTRTQTIL